MTVKVYRLHKMYHMPTVSTLCGDSIRPCAFCKRELKNKPRYWVHIVAGGYSICHMDDSVALSADPNYIPGDMGLHEIGPECRKAVPKEFVLEWDGALSRGTRDNGSHVVGAPDVTRRQGARKRGEAPPIARGEMPPSSE